MWKNISIVIALLCLAANAAHSAPIQWNGNGHWYEAELAASGNISWTEAQDAAVAAGGYLATVTALGENEFVYGLVAGDSRFWFKGYLGPWLGGYQEAGAPERAAGWRWVTDELWSYTNWNSGEPNDNLGRTEEDRLHFFGASGWNDAPNDLTIYSEAITGYVIEYIPEPATLSLLVLGGLALIRRRHSQPGWPSLGQRHCSQNPSRIYSHVQP